MTPKRHQFTAADARRILSALCHTAEDGDPADLAELLELQRFFERCIRDTVDHMRSFQGFTWATIAEATGTTRQAAQQRWGTR